jgi:hypothetical protein
MVGKGGGAAVPRWGRSENFQRKGRAWVAAAAKVVRAVVRVMASQDLV